VTATPNTGYVFVNWTDSGTEVSTSASYSFTAAANRNLVAHFRILSYVISTSSNPSSGGTTSGDGTYDHNQSVLVEATPNAGYKFVDWTENGIQVSKDANYTFPATSARVLVANFDFATGVDEVAPVVFSLSQNYPNPFNPETQIKFSVEKAAPTTLVVYSMTGAVVATLFDGHAEAGRYYRVKFGGPSLASGLYVYRLRSGDRTEVKKMLLIR
jgi:uncharacterized repeat protein (TIGR02543 family)